MPTDTPDALVRPPAVDGAADVATAPDAAADAQEMGLLLPDRDAPISARRQKVDGHIVLRRKKQAKFLEHFREKGNMTFAAKEAKCGVSTVHEWRRNDEVFARAWTQALEESTDRLEMEARRRAEDGWDEPVYQRGAQVGVVRKYSDLLMVTLLKGYRPQKFKERVESTVTGVHAVAVKDLSNESTEELLARLTALQAKWRGEPPPDDDGNGGLPPVAP